MKGAKGTRSAKFKTVDRKPLKVKELRRGEETLYSFPPTVHWF